MICSNTDVHISNENIFLTILILMSSLKYLPETQWARDPKHKTFFNITPEW